MGLKGDDREELEQEARRVGIDEPNRLSRPELARRLALAARRGATALRFAGSLAGAVVRGVIDAATQRNAPAPRQPPPPPERPTPAAKGTAPTPTPSPQAPTPRADPGSSRPQAPTPTTAVRAPTTPPSVAEPAEDEPILTKTLARLLAQQGHRRRALAMYEALRKSHPDDATLAEEMGALRSEGDADEPPPEEMVSVAVDEHTVWVSWHVSETGVNRANRLLGTPGKLAVRVAVTAPDEERIVRTDAHELTDVDAQGDWVVRGLPEGARATASVGVIGEGRFVSIAHHRTR